jgi:hypothetical protein
VNPTVATVATPEVESTTRNSGLRKPLEER